MLADPAGAVMRVVVFAGEAIDAQKAAQIAHGNSFERMQARERAGDFDKRYGPALRQAPLDAPAAALKVRRGVAGGYRDELSAEDAAYVDAAIMRSDYANRMASFRA